MRVKLKHDWAGFCKKGEIYKAAFWDGNNRCVTNNPTDCIHIFDMEWKSKINNIGIGAVELLDDENEDE